MSNKEAERVLAAEQLDTLRYLAQTMTEWSERWAGRVTNHTLEVATAVFDSSGVVTRSYGTAIGSIEVTNLSNLTPATVTNVQASNTFASAAVGAVSLPNGAAITGFTVEFQTGTAGNANITVTNVAGGTMNFSVNVPATGLSVPITFPNPLPATSSGVAPTVNVPSIATGPAYSITVYGQTTTAGTSGKSVTVSPGGPLSAVPTAGIGVAIIPAGVAHTVALVSRQFTLYGTQGDTVTFQVFTPGLQPTTV